MAKSLSLFFPCYNEEQNIEKTVTRAVSVLGRMFDNYEIIVVDDGSRDRTGAIVTKIAAMYPEVRLVKHEQNLGYGAALRSVIFSARYDLVCFSDGDGQFNMEEIAKFLPLIENYDLVLGYRMERQDPWYRVLNAWLYRAGVNLLFNLGVKDIDCAFKMFHREIFSRIEIESNGAVASAEMLIKAKKLGYRFAEVGVTHLPREHGEPTGAKLKVIFKAFSELLKLWRRLA